MEASPSDWIVCCLCCEAKRRSAMWSRFRRASPGPIRSPPRPQPSPTPSGRRWECSLFVQSNTQKGSFFISRFHRNHRGCAQCSQNSHSCCAPCQGLAGRWLLRSLFDGHPRRFLSDSRRFIVLVFVRLAVCVVIGHGLVLGKIVLVLAVLVGLFVLGEIIGDGGRLGLERWERWVRKVGCRCRTIAIDLSPGNGGRRVLEITVCERKQIWHTTWIQWSWKLELSGRVCFEQPFDYLF